MDKYPLIKLINSIIGENEDTVNMFLLMTNNNIGDMINMLWK